MGLSAEQTSRRFQIVGSGAFAEAVSIEHDRDADLQDAVINSAVIQIDSLLHNGKRDIRGDDHGLAGQQPFVNHIEHSLLTEAGVTFCPQIIQNEEVGAHKRFHVIVAVRTEVTLHTVDYIRHSHKEDGLQTVNQSVGYGEGKNAVAGTGGNFSFYDLGEPLLVGDCLNEAVAPEKIREYIWFMETKQPYAPPIGDNPYYLGKHNSTGYYFYYEPQRVTVLDYAFLSTITEKADGTVIYADRCSISEDKLAKMGITFKKIPRDISRL